MFKEHRPHGPNSHTGYLRSPWVYSIAFSLPLSAAKDLEA